jgi:hypothetical protein
LIEGLAKRLHPTAGEQQSGLVGSVESTVGLTPQGNAVHFEPTPEVTEWLQKTW